MPNILHRLSIAAPPELVHELAATRAGVERWWTGRPVTGEDTVGGRISVYFSDPVNPAATFEILERTPSRIVWRTVDGPSDWIDTRIVFAFAPWGEHGTTLLFRHEGWREENEFMSGCATNWAAYLMSLKSGAETQAFRAYPASEISCWS